MDEKCKQDGPATVEHKRKSYQTPHLQLYGTVQSLTATGTGNPSEANDPTDGCRRNSGFKPCGGN